MVRGACYSVVEGSGAWRSGLEWGDVMECDGVCWSMMECDGV
jgi:hypothetical protein